MTVYLINIFLVVFWGYLLLYNKNSDKNAQTYCVLVAFQWILISGLRHISIGADTEAYKYYFDQVKSISWSKVFSNFWDYLFNGLDIKDPGYTLIQKVFQIFCNDYQAYLIFIAFIFTSLMAIWIYKNSKDPCFSFLLYSVLFYSFYALTGHRQTIATALIVFWGYKYIKERKLVKFALLAFAAFLIHKSSLVFIPYYFVANIPITPFYVLIALAVVFIVALMGSSLYAPLSEFLGFNKEQIEYAKGGAETYAAVLTLMCIVILCCYNFYKNRTENANRIFNVTLLTLMSSLLVFQNQSFMRIQQYFSLFLCVSFPEIIDLFEKKSRIYVYFVTFSLLILYLIRNNPKYLFFWQ